MSLPDQAAQASQGQFFSPTHHSSTLYVNPMRYLSHTTTYGPGWTEYWPALNNNVDYYEYSPDQQEAPLNYQLEQRANSSSPTYTHTPPPPQQQQSYSDLHSGVPSDSHIDPKLQLFAFNAQPGNGQYSYQNKAPESSSHLQSPNAHFGRQAHRETGSDTDSEKSNGENQKNKSFLRKGRSGTVYTVCPKMSYKCLWGEICKATKQKACDMKDHYFTAHALFNSMQCDACGNSYARPCTYKRHLREDKSCPKPRTLTAEQISQGKFRKQIMKCFADMTDEAKVREGIQVMKQCNKRPEMRKRKRRINYRKQDVDEVEEEPVVAYNAEVGTQFTAVNAHPQLSPPPQGHNYSYPDAGSFDFGPPYPFGEISYSLANELPFDPMMSL